MSDVMMRWHIVTSQEFAAGEKVDVDLYFLSDTHEIYRGNESYTQSIALYETSLPTNPALNRLYINKTTLEGYVWNGIQWDKVVKAIADTITADGTDPVSGKAVADYVAVEIQKISSSFEGLKDVSYDADEHLMTFTKTDNSTKDILLTNIGCSISCVDNKLQLLDASGNKIGDAVDLDIERFVTGGEYDESTKSIILYFDNKTGDESTDKISIPVGDLVDTYTVEGSSSIDLTMVANKITAALKISSEADNAAEIKEDGLYVPKVDTSGLMPKATGATKDNIAIFDENGNVVDSGKTIEEAAGAPTLYQGTDIIVEEAVGDATPKKGDFCVISTSIGTDTGKYSKTAYWYDGAAWVAMDGNVNAENVYFPEDLMTTSAIGNITLTNGQATIPAAGKNLKQVFDTIFVKEKNPTITQPSVSLSAPQNKAYEVGTSVTPSYSASLNAGKYEYGPATGVSASSWSITDTDGNSSSEASGSFPAITVGDDTNYKITVVANHTEGAIPLTNTGNAYTSGQIVSGNKSATSSAITGYRCGFYGTKDVKTDEIHSALVRSLSNKTTSAPSAGTVWNMSIPVGAMRAVFAYPATIRDVNSVLDVNGLNAEIKTAFTKYTINVEGANGYDTASYKVYVIDFASANDTANTYKITL